MLLTIIRHAWLGIARSDFFHKGLMVKVLTLFFIFLFGVFTYDFAHSLPAILLEHFPQRQPAEWVFSFLVFIMMFDMITRFASQKLPMAYFIPYTHLPLPKWKPASIWLIKSVFDPANVYFLFFFWPFITQTINPELSSQGLGVLGIFMLLLLNHSIYIYIRTALRARLLSGKIIGLCCLFLVALSIIYNDVVMPLSLNMFLGFLNGNELLFVGLAGFIILFQALTFINLKSGYFDVAGHGVRRVNLIASKGRPFNLISLHPSYGIYWWLEWQLVLRNRHIRNNFWILPLIGIGITIFIAVFADDMSLFYATILLMFAGGYGVTHFQNILSWESRFFDFLATRDINLRDFLTAKYYFYLFFATVQFLIVIPVLAFLKPSFIILYMALYIYACGVGYYILIRLGVNNSCRFDPNGSISFNYESLSGKSFLVSLLLFTSIIPFYILNTVVDIPNIGMWIMGAIGLAAILLHKWWINGIVQILENQLHRNLALYRSK
ncbi:MAG TPA: DUF5687 family protein [Bacteroidales bacterium]|nr:DUF5687 family protein [Bacteroidales bacterium]